MEENVAVVVSIIEVQSLINYLGTKPYNEVKGIFEAVPRWPGITQSQVDMLFPAPEVNE
jgi:hypothetical protein